MKHHVGTVKKLRMIDYCFSYHRDRKSGKYFVEKRYPYKDREKGKITWYLDSVFETLEGARHWCERRNLNLKWY